ncbi:hypothetical protein CSW50_10065 [Thermus scotoductus]|uniref:Uncharacterized protein n=1 Tax=Thermus scotoductus TaxID=37636 RepID=A0A430R0J8_THESC|nr:hypothetical protein [Thermus scotoductus]RTH00926.1 hypothetical protein CSW50_10065 [Thermus scotoductus]
MEGDILRIPVRTSTGEVEEVYDLSSLPEGEAVPGPSLAVGEVAVGALAYAIREGEQVRAVVLDWVDQFAQFAQPPGQPPVEEEAQGGAP